MQDNKQRVAGIKWPQPRASWLCQCSIDVETASQPSTSSNAQPVTPSPGTIFQRAHPTHRSIQTQLTFATCAAQTSSELAMSSKDQQIMAEATAESGQGTTEGCARKWTREMCSGAFTLV